MAEALTDNLYNYCRLNGREIEVALDNFLANKERLAQDDSAKKLISYVENIKQTLVNPVQDEIFAVLDRASVKFLEPVLVQKFLVNPKDKVIRDALTIELLLINGSLGAVPNDRPYNADELMLLEGPKREEIYDPVTMASTWFVTSRIPDQTKTATFLMNQLRSIAGSVGFELYDWGSAFLNAQMIRTAWAVLPILSEDDQKFLLQNYFFVGVAVGTPVRMILEKYVRNMASAQRSDRNSLLLEALIDSKEIVPLDLTTGEGKTFGEIFKQAQARGGKDIFDSFEQTKFIDELYGTQKERDSFVAWLREALTAALYLQSKKFLA